MKRIIILIIFFLQSVTLVHADFKEFISRKFNCSFNKVEIISEITVPYITTRLIKCGDASYVCNVNRKFFNYTTCEKSEEYYDRMYRSNKAMIEKVEGRKK